MHFPLTRSVGRIMAGLLPALLLACDAGLGTGSGSGGGQVPWTGRHLVASDLAWSVREDLDSSQMDTLEDDYNDKGFMLAGIDAISDGMTVQYTTLWHENRDNRDWAFALDLSAEGLGDAMQSFSNAGLRPLSIEVYEAGGEIRYAAIWIENREGLAWSAGVEILAQDYDDFSQVREDHGLRPVDIELYEFESAPAFAAIWYENTLNLSSVQLLMLDQADYLAAVDDYESDGYRLIDTESRETVDGRRYAALLENPADNNAWRREDDLTSAIDANRSREYADLGYRPIDLEHFEDGGEAHITSVWLETDFRYRYPRKDDVHAAVEQFRDDYDIPGISVAIIEHGEVIYRRGVGFADVENARVAHGRTVYNAASLSKVFGATLAARMESTGLHDGTPVGLNLADLTSTWLTDIEVPDAGGTGTQTVSLPGHHTHTLEQLAAHLGCVGHYNEIPNQTEHYEWGSHAAPSIWDAPLLDDCDVGEQREYSTHGFTLLQAAVEQSAGQRFSELLEQELSVPWELDSLRAQFAEETLPENDDRAVPYDDDGEPTTYQNSSWKVMGGGIEVDAMDMARFGWLTLRARIVSPSVRDNRLWASVAPGCTSPWEEARCRNGIGWRLGSHMGEMTPVHGGSWRGARSELRVYPQQQLVIAVMANYRGPETNRVPADDLVRDLAEIILE